MVYVDFKVAGEDYKLRLNARSLIVLEKKLGHSPLSIFNGVQSNELPELGKIISVLHSSLQSYQSKMNEDAVYEMFDNYVEEGGSLISLIPVIIEVFKVSGLIPKDEVAEESKN